jgi:hypothetical protein
LIVDSYKFLPRSFRPFYEGRGAFPGEEERVWAPFAKRLADSRIALLTSAGIYLRGSQPAFDVDREQTNPEWGDPTWRAIPAVARPEELAVAHLHINDDDVVADPEIALPMRALAELADTVTEHVSVMGYQDRSLREWRSVTAPAIAAHLREQGADGLVLAPA